MRLNQFLFIGLLTFLLLVPFNLICEVEGNGYPYHITFSKWDDNENGTKWTGSAIGAEDVKADKIRISLYNNHKDLKENGLISDYFQDESYGHYLKIIDPNQNTKLDPGDIIYLYEKDEVKSTWGIVLTYEPDGRVIGSNTIDGKRFQMDDKSEENSIPLILFLIGGLSIIVLVLILGLKLKRKE